MNLKIGQIIKKLRQENKITQEQLANALYVSPQAISRWESGTCYPDIESLPMLADVFSVSVDELIGYKLSEREEELASIKKEMSRLGEVGKISERIAFARESMAKYPFDFEIKVNLATCLYHLWNDIGDDSLLPEAKSLCRSVIDDCRDEDVRYSAIFTLSTIYAECKEPSKALEILELLVPMKYCREFAKSNGVGDGNTEIYIQDEIDKLTDCLGTSIVALVLHEDLPNDPSTWDKKIKMLETSNALYKMIYGDDLMFYHVRLSRNYWLISTYQISQGKEDEAICSLERSCFHAIEYDKAYANEHGKTYTSIFTDKLIYPHPGKDFHELSEHNECYYILDRLQHKRYDEVRSDHRFATVINELEERAN